MIIFSSIPQKKNKSLQLAIAMYSIICKRLRPLECWVYISGLGLIFQSIISCYGYGNDPVTRELIWAHSMATFRADSNCMSFDMSSKKANKQSVSDSKGGPNSDPASWPLKI